MLWRGLRAVVWIYGTILVLTGMPPAAHGQPEQRTAGTTTNLFASVDGGPPVDGVVLDMPPAWRVESVVLLRYGTQSVPVRLDRDDPAGVLVLADRSLRSPFELVIRVRLPDRPGRQEWSVQSVARARKGAEGEDRGFRRFDRHTQRVELSAPRPPTESNRALSMDGARSPVVLAADAVPPLGDGASFTIECWVRTTGLNEGLLSTWDGREETAYSVELLIDWSGRLRLYSGRPGRHEGLWTEAPVANGQWHHVAVVYDAEQARLRLVLNGAAVDSLDNYHPPRSEAKGGMTVGGRAEAPRGTKGPTPGAGSLSPFSGTIDEFRIWDRARSTANLRRDRRRLGPPGGIELYLGFDEESPEVPSAVEAWPEGARRSPSTLTFQAPLRDLRARTEGEAVTLRWTVQAPDVTFVVERSTDQRTFTPIGRVDAPRAPRPRGMEEDPLSYTDDTVPDRVVYYRVRTTKQGKTTHTSPTLKVGMGARDEEEHDADVRLVGNFPNPFSETTTLEYEVNEPMALSLTVWTLSGSRVATLADKRHEEGYYKKPFDASNLPSGSYFVRLQSPQGSQSHKMTLLR